MGLMSGTSMDGIDAVVLEIEGTMMSVRAALAREWPGPLQRRLRSAAEHAESTALAELGELDTAVGLQLALTAEQLLRSAGLRADAIRAIGSHGQTILHRPTGEHPFTLQIGDPNVI